MLNSIPDTMKALSISRSSIYKLINAGRLETVKIGRRTLIKASSITSLVEGSDSIN